jgi:hypothetical protein
MGRSLAAEGFLTDVTIADTIPILNKTAMGMPIQYPQALNMPVPPDGSSPSPFIPKSSFVSGRVGTQSAKQDTGMTKIRAARINAKVRPHLWNQFNPINTNNKGRTNMMNAVQAMPGFAAINEAGT